ncbi:MAG TPA: type I-U CRISPR-associated helicase/endonuclease Cas3 [Actinomycetota bacterium]|nr:type I-U CRISPR-associated helicase/endonuclease Cas3 [Actinomycetota bacterium]
MGEGLELFERFFRAVHGVEPFAWQRALAERVIEGPGWPAAVDVPTGFGKTAALDVAVVALASQADLPPAERTAPTRTFLVVDRRLLVDQAFDRARRIAAALEAPEDDAVRRVAEGLRRVGGGPRPLEVVRMRGGVTWSWRWLASPAQPAVIAGTVDQFGSRLLFRGYGVGERLRPIDAALCGRDALVLLDEAHLAPALVETVRRAHALEARVEAGVLPRRAPRPVLLSATLRGSEAREPDVLRARADAEGSEAARRRLSASRRLALCELGVRARDGRVALAGTIARLAARALVEGDGGIERVAVVANTVEAARAAFEELRAAVGDRADVELLVGRCRGFEREQLGLADRIRGAFAAVEPRPPRPRPAALVATQTIEVGADLDVDLLVTEAAPLDALLQRLGRLNRLGLRERAEAICVFAPALHAEDPVYGDAVARTWEWLRARASAEPAELDPRRPSAEAAPRLELGLRELASLVGPEDLEACAARPAETPVLVAPHLDAWARTSPAPDPDQPVEPFLHGLDRGAAEVSVCWRAGLPDLEAWRAELDALPVREEERVEVPLWAARRFLRGLPLGPLADLEGVAEPVEGEAARGVAAVVQRVDGTVERLADPGALRPGDTVIVDPSAGGHDPWGWTGAPGTVPDVADLVPRRRPAIRVRPGVLAWATGEDPAAFRSRLAQPESSPQELAEGLLREAVAKARAREDADPVLRRWADHAERMLHLLAEGRATAKAPGAGALAAELGLLVQARGRAVDDEAGDEGESGTSFAPVPVPLSRHSRDVGERARAFAELLGLPAELVRAVELAGLLHDAGKAERRFQVMLHRGDPDRLEASGVVLAKSGMDPADRAAFRRARVLAGVPAGWRHEAASLAVAERVLEAVPDIDDQLVSHLVAAHHGSGRPLFPPVEGTVRLELLGVDGMKDAGSEAGGLGEGWRLVAAALGAGDVEVDHVDWRGPRRLAVLCRRYGWWGLALLEAIVRLADMAVSEEYG